MSAYDFDAAVLGGGPAGAAAAAYLAKGGMKVAVFEQDVFPRPHVGESLVPACNPVLRELGLWDELKRQGFSRKTGAAWTSATGGSGRILAQIRLAEANETFHVDRARFDALLLRQARDLGAEVFTGLRVKHVDFSDPAAPRVQAAFGRQSIEAKVRVVIDASGRRTLLGSQLGLKVNDPQFNQFALHTWFEGYRRRTYGDDPQAEDFIFIHFLPMSNSWIWQIPITESVTSIGVVTQRRDFRGAANEREDFFWECVSTVPDLAAGLREAKRIRPLEVESDYSYSMKEICGDGFVLVGDAARFVDPIFSSGVSIALQCARFASLDILAAAREGDFRKQRFQSFETVVRRGLKNWYEFVTLYYRLNVLFTSFIQDPRYGDDVFRLLQGNVYSEDSPEVLQIMRRTADSIESNPAHPWHQMLGRLTEGRFQAAHV